MRRNAWAIAVGAVVTAVVTGGLFVGQMLLPMEALTLRLYELSGVWLEADFFSQLRVLGGVPGGLLAGYLSRDRFDNDSAPTGAKSGVLASVIGLGLLYAAFVPFSVAYLLLAVRTVPDLYFVLVVPLLVGIPLLFVYVVTGLLTGLVGNEASALLGR